MHYRLSYTAINPNELSNIVAISARSDHDSSASSDSATSMLETVSSHGKISHGSFVFFFFGRVVHPGCTRSKTRRKRPSLVRRLRFPCCEVLIFAAHKGDFFSFSHVSSVSCPYEMFTLFKTPLFHRHTRAHVFHFLLHISVAKFHCCYPVHYSNLRYAITQRWFRQNCSMYPYMVQPTREYVGYLQPSLFLASLQSSLSVNLQICQFTANLAN